MKKILAVLVLAAGALHAQVSNPSIIQPPSSPAGNSCTNQLPLQVYQGTLYSCQSGVVTALGGSGTVTSVAMTMPGVIFNTTVSGSPITTSGTLAPSLLTQTANTVFAGPATGSAATPTFRALASADIPNNAVTLAKLATQAANTVLANVTGGSAVPTAAAIPSGMQFYTAGTGYSTVTGAQWLSGAGNQTANTVLGALTATTPSDLAVPSCSSASNALTWTSGTGFGCNTISGSGTVNSGTSGHFSYYASSTNAVSNNSHIDDGATTASTVTVTEPLTVAAGGSSSISIGTDNSAAGTLLLSNNAANAHTVLGSAATTTNTILFPATAPTNLHCFYAAVSGTTTTLTDCGYSYNAVPNADLAHSTISGVSLGNNLAAATFENSGSGAASGSTYTGASTLDVSYNTIGAAPAITNDTLEISSFTAACNQPPYDVSNAGAQTITAPAVPATGNCIITIKNKGAGTWTFTGSSNVYDLESATPGTLVSSATITTNQSRGITADGTNFWMSASAPTSVLTGVPAAITGTTITANTQLNLGASGTLAPLVMGNATSGTMTIQPVTGAISGTMLIPVPAGLTRFTQTIGEGTITVTGDAPTSGACAAEHTVSVTNLLTTDVVRVGFNGDPSGVTGIAPVSTGGVFIVAYPKAAGTLGLKVCNDTALTITVGTLVLNWTVQR